MLKRPRQPGGLVNVSTLVERAREVLGQLDERQAKTLRPVIESFIAFARVQAEINRRLLDGYNSLPMRHGDTHKGGNDSVEGTSLPAQITPDDAGAIGLPQEGYAPMLHRHPVVTSPPIAVGMGNIEGTGQAFARADHQHDGVPWVAGVRPHVHLASDIPNFSAASAAASASLAADDANVILAARIFGG